MGVMSRTTSDDQTATLGCAAVIIAGGHGRRLAAITGVLPKVLVPLGDRTLLDHLLDQVRKARIGEVHLLLGQHAGLVRAYLDAQDLAGGTLDVRLHERTHGLGTAGPLRAVDSAYDDWLVVNGDVFTDAALADIVEAHRASGADLTVCTTEHRVASPYAVVELDETSALRRLEEKPTLRFPVSAGIYVLGKRARHLVDGTGPLDMPEFIQRCLDVALDVRGHPLAPASWFDLGTDADYRSALEAAPAVLAQRAAPTVPARSGRPAPRSSGLTYVPFGPKLDGIPHVMVDALRSGSTVLELSHWPGNRTPARYKADVSTQIVMSLLAADECAQVLAGVETVSCDHFDVDGLLSVWAMTAPRVALGQRRHVESVALVGDFDVYRGEAAVKSCLALEAAADAVAGSAEFRAAPDTTTASEILFSRVLEVAADCLSEPERWRESWWREWEHVLFSLRYLDAHPDAIEEHPHLDLAVVRSPAYLHQYAVNARTDLLHVAESTADGRHRLRFRYESFVDLQSRTAGPRIRGDVLAGELNQLDPGGTWLCDPPDSATPCLQRFAAAQTPAPSALPFDRFVDLVAGFYARGLTDPSLRWRSDPSWVDTTPVPPPSGAR